MSTYSTPSFGRGPAYDEWLAHRREADRVRSATEQQQDLRFLLELCLRASAPGHETRRTSDFLDTVGEKPAWAAAALEALCAPASSLREAVAATLSELPPLDAEGVVALASFASGNTSRSDTVRAALDRLIDDRRFPHAFEYDYIDDIEEIVLSRSAFGDRAHSAISGKLLAGLRTLVSDAQSEVQSPLPALVRAVVGDSTRYLPRRGEMSKRASAVIPDLADEFIALEAHRNPARFLEINRQYSKRQRDVNGSHHPGGLSILVGYEREPHLMLRNFLNLRNSGRLKRDDEVLVIGPRHANELDFFRRNLGFRRVTGLDLFDVPSDGIVGGDMHDMRAFADGRFRLVYCCGTLSYAYSVRRVIEEIARVVARPGFVVLSDAGDRVHGVDPLGRSDPMSARSLLQTFHRHRFETLFEDDGVPQVTEHYSCWPCVGLELV